MSGRCSRRIEPGAAAWFTLEARVFQGFRRLAETRAALAVLAGTANSEPLRTMDGVLAYLRADDTGRRLLGLANVADGERRVPGDLLATAGLERPVDVLRLDERVQVTLEGVTLPAHAAAWLLDESR